MKFNNKSFNNNKTINYEGETAFRLDPFMELYSLVVTSNLSDKFYEKSSNILNRLKNLY